MGDIKNIALRLPVGLAARVDEVRGEVPRNRWLVRAVERALGDDTQLPSPAGREARSDVVELAARPPATSPRGATRPLAPAELPDGVVRARDVKVSRLPSLSDSWRR